MPDPVSIIICTRNRAASLRETLASVGKCVVPPDLTAELLVVDNGSTDGTVETVRGAALANLPVRCILETTPGLSHARNAGLRAGVGDVFLFTDDDVRVPRDWIDGMSRPIFSGGVDAVAGGVRFPASYESALAREPFNTKRGWFASSYGVDPVKPEFMVGANMAFHRRVIERVGTFDTNLGAGAFGFYEETQFTWRLLEAGFRLGAALETSVEHHFDLSRLTRETLIGIAQRMGKSEAYINYHWHGNAAAVERATIWRARLLLLSERLLKPWNILTASTTVEELQRVQTLAYWQQLARFAGTPRNYQRTADSTPAREPVGTCSPGADFQK